MSVAAFGKSVTGAGVGTFAMCYWFCIDGSGVLFLACHWWIRGGVQMASGAVGSIDMVDVSLTLEVGVVPTLEVDDGSTLEGGMNSICLGIHLFRLDFWIVCHRVPRMPTF